ncbi:MAG: PAS domain S-box protein [Candidatus Scalindua sp.]
MKTQGRIYILTSLVFVIVLSICGAFIYSIEHKRKVELHKTVFERGTSIGRSLERQLDRSLSATFALASILRQSGTIDNFDTLAEDMIHSFGGISSLQLAPNGIVSNIYPLEGNEKAIGHDLLKDPDRREEALTTIRSKQLTLAGPLDLIQGGKAIIGRYPVFMNDKESNEEHFWGFTIVLIKLSKLLEAVNFEQLISSGYDYKLSRIESNSDKHIVFAKSDEEIAHWAVSTEINVPNGKWRLYIAPRDGWYSPLYITIEVIFAILIGTIISLLSNRIVRSTNTLRSTNEMLTSEIVERKQVSQELQRINKQLQISIEQMPVGYILWDKEFRVLEWNHAAERIFGYSKCEMLGKFALDIIVPDDRRQQVGKVIENLQEGKVASYSEKNNNIRKDGKLISCQWHNTPLKSGTGKTVAILSMIEDITEKKKMEEVLLQSEKLKSIGTITSGVAHEFNNILAIISGNAQLLEESRKDDEELANALRIIKRATNDGAEISKRMLKFTKTAKDTAGFVTFDINELINQAIDFIRPRWKNMAQVKGINYHMDTEGMKRVPSILCNPTELREVFVNIINNALDAMPDDGRITFRTWSEEDTVFISISDTGEGMSEDVIKKIFDPFFTTKGVVGTGLGMSTAYGIVTGHDGKIEVESKVGRGSIFTLQFPTAVKTVSPMISPEPEQDTKSKSLRILVVDDEEAICNILDKFLSKKGHMVRIVGNGRKAIILTKATDFDLVLCDLAMPDVFGYDVIKALNKLEKRPKIGIITGWDEKLKPIDDEGLKVDFIIKKPFDLSELSRHINDGGN